MGNMLSDQGGAEALWHQRPQQACGKGLRIHQVMAF
jgi:hypothetical protein